MEYEEMKYSGEAKLSRYGNNLGPLFVFPVFSEAQSHGIHVNCTVNKKESENFCSKSNLKALVTEDQRRYLKGAGWGQRVN